MTGGAEAAPPADASASWCYRYIDTYTNPYTGEQYLFFSGYPLPLPVPRWSASPQPAGAHSIEPTTPSQLRMIPGYKRHAHAVVLDGVPLQH